MSAAIHLEGVSKHYRGSARSSLRDDIASLTRRTMGRSAREVPPVKALTDVSFEIPEGQATALLGLNGAGKTTALKLITRIAYPTAGTLSVRGRVGALIEVGTGMHPELTGRENVQLYGRILGLSRRDILQRFGQILQFADIGSAIDQPVKQYSSGMQLRLGFSVAAHLEPDILVVDEAIAVGDGGFQYRCVERMSQLVREGRTLVLVSHDMSAIETLCERAILLKRGHVAHDGPARDVVRGYIESIEEERVSSDGERLDAGDRLRLTRVTLHGATGEEVDSVASGARLKVRLHYDTREPIERPLVSVGLSVGQLGCFSMASMLVDGESPDLLEGPGHIDCEFLDLPLQPRTYEVWIAIRGAVGFGDLVDWRRYRVFRVTGDVEGGGMGAVTHSLADAPIKLPYRWGFNT